MSFFKAVLAVTFCNLAASLKAKAWQSLSDVPDATDFPEYELLKSKPNTAIGFSGGGSRAYVAAFGYLSALNKLDLIKNVKYIGGISGGTWGTISYTYAQNVKDENAFLGDIVPPEKIVYSDLQTMDPACARSLAAPQLVVTGLQAFNASEVDKLSDSWAYGVSKTYFEPLGIKENTRFSWNANSVKEIKTRNSELVNEEFLLPTNADRPFPIIGATFVGPAAGGPYQADNQNYSFIEFTPLYVGQFKTLDIDYKYKLGLKHTKRFGGAVESFAYGVEGTNPTLGLTSTQASSVLSVPTPSTILDLKYVGSASSYAPGTLFESVPKDGSNILGLSMDYWSPADKVIYFN
jgi:hypothetical protein